MHTHNYLTVRSTGRMFRQRQAAAIQQSSVVVRQAAIAIEEVLKCA